MTIFLNKKKETQVVTQQYENNMGSGNCLWASIS
jgi:hypothetical protein